VITGCKVTIFRRRGCKGTTFDSWCNTTFKLRLDRRCSVDKRWGHL
jgi:hypothetical protein